MIRLFITSFCIFLILFLSFISLAEDSQLQKELFRTTTKDNELSAVWIGSDKTIDSALEGMPLTFGVHKLVFEFINSKEKIEFKPKGELFFNDWSFNIFSPDFQFVALLQDHFGPYHIISIKNLRDYLLGKNVPYDIVDGSIPDGPAAIHGEIKWISKNKIEFGAACCGGGYKVVHEIGGKTKRGKWKSHRKKLK